MRLRARREEKMKMTLKDMEITMNMWGMAYRTIQGILRKLRHGQNHRFCNGMRYNPQTQELETGTEK